MTPPPLPINYWSERRQTCESAKKENVKIFSDVGTINKSGTSSGRFIARSRAILPFPRSVLSARVARDDRVSAGPRDPAWPAFRKRENSSQALARRFRPRSFSFFSSYPSLGVCSSVHGETWILYEPEKTCLFGSVPRTAWGNNLLRCRDHFGASMVTIKNKEKQQFIARKIILVIANKPRV